MCSLNWYVARLSHPQTVVATAPTEWVGKPPFFDTPDIFKFFTFSNLRCEKEHISLFKQCFLF